MFQNLKAWLTSPDSSTVYTATDLVVHLRVTLSVGIGLGIFAGVGLYVWKDPGWDRLLYITALFVGITLALLVLLRRAYLRFVTLALVVSYSLVFLIGAVTGVGVRGTAYSGLILIVMLAGLFIGRRAALVTAALCILAGPALIGANALGFLPNAGQPLGEAATWLNLSAYFILTALILNFALNQIERALAQARRELTERAHAEDEARRLNTELERHIAERTAQLAANEERYRLISTVSSDYMFSTRLNAEGQLALSWVAGAFESITGFTLDEYVASGGWLARLHPDDREQDTRDMAALNANQRVVTEVRTLAKSGALRWVRVYAHPVWDSQRGQLIGIDGAVQDITERKQAEAGERTITRGLRAVVDAADELLLTPDLDTFCRRAVELAREKLGVERCGLLLFDAEMEYQFGTYGTTLQGQTSDERSLRLRLRDDPNAQTLLAESGKPWQITHGERATAEGGQRRVIGEGWVAGTLIRSRMRPIGILYNDAAISGAPVNESQQEMVAVYCSLLGNIIERKRAEAALRESEQRFRALVEQLPAITYTDDAGQMGRTLYISPQLETTLGYTPAEWLAGDLDFWLAHVHPDDRDRALAEYEQCFHHGEPVNSEYRMLARDGRDVWLHDRAARLDDEAGQPHLIQGVLVDISERKRAEAREHARLHNLRAVVAAADELIRIQDLDTLYRRAVELAREKLGIERCGLFVLDDSHEVLAGTYGTDLKGNTSDERTVRFPASVHPELFMPSAEPWYFREREQTYFDGEGMRTASTGWIVLTIIRAGSDPIGTFSNDTAITHAPADETQQESLALYCSLLGNIIGRKRVEAALARERDLLEALMTSVPDTIYFKDTTSRFTRINQAQARLLGVPTPEAALGKTDLDFMPAELAGTFYAEEQELMRNGAPLVNREEYNPTPDGQPRWLTATKVPLRDAQGQIVGLVGISRDITQRKQVEEREALRQAMMEKVIDLGKAITQLTDLGQCLREIHQSVQLGLGFDRVGLFLYDAASGQIRGVFGTSRTGEIEDTSWFAQSVTENDAWQVALSASRGMSVIDDYEAIHDPAPDNEMRAVKQHVTLAAWAGEKPVALIAADNVISRRRFSEEQLEALQLFAGYAGLAIENARWNAELERRVAERTAELEAANRELESIAYTIAHDLRIPARAMHGFAHILKDSQGQRLDAEALGQLNRILENARRMGQLVDDLLSFIRLGRVSLHLQQVAMRDLVARALYELESQRAGRQIEIEIADLPDCEADPALIQQVWHQLLANAFKFTRPHSAARIEIGAGERESAPYYYVRDDGVGFDMQYADKLFGVFQRLHLDEDFEGTGVGLAIVKRIIERHGGRVWAEAEVDKGATFYFTLTPG